MYQNLKNQKRSLPTFLFQVIVATCFLAAFSIYVLAVQFKYDDAARGFGKALYFALVIFGGGLSYDCAKTILFMQQSSFLRFVCHLGESVAHLIFVIALCLISAYSFNQHWTYAGQIAYLLALLWLYFVIDSSSKAIEVVTARQGPAAGA